jgi:hypothetical protein
MGKQGSAGFARPKHQTSSVKRGGIVKPRPMSALAASVLARRADSGPSSATSTAMAMLSQQMAVPAQDDSSVIDERLVGLLHECLADAGGMAPLTTLGSALRDKSTRLSLAEGTARTAQLHKAIKDRWGGLEAFVRARSGEFVLGLDCNVQARDVSTLELASPGPEQLPAGRNVVASDDVNALTLDAL